MADGALLDGAFDYDLLSNQRWRIDNLYSVKDEKGRRLPFRLNDAQRELFDNLHGRDIILKARQLGFTTAMCIWYMDSVIWQSDISALIIAHRQDDARKIFRNKIKWVWDCFCEDWPELVEALDLNIAASSASELRLSNGSGIEVDVSGRSGTFQYVLVTEFGKLNAQFPARADEVVSGTLNAAHKDARVTIESTAEGQDGHFYRMCRLAQEISPGREWPTGEDDLDFDTREAVEKRELTKMDYKFHFFPWWQDERYVLNPKMVRVPAELDKYFDGVESLLSIKLTAAQRAWYAKKDEEQGGLITREYPSHPAEAFAAALEGCYYEQQLLAARRWNRIGDFPVVAGVPVNTFWDLGRSDLTAIWLHQRIGERNRFVGYYEASGEFISHYVKWLNQWSADNNATFGVHHGPHDVVREDLFLEHGRTGAAKAAGIVFHPVPAPRVKQEAIEAVRGVFPSCDFDQRTCALGLKRLRHYRKEYDTVREIFLDRPRHDINSHGADAFDTFARGFRAAAKRSEKKRRERRFTGGLV